MGHFVDLYGARKVLIVVIILLGFACFLFGTATGVITLSLSFMCLRFLDQGSMMLGATNLVAQWFDIRRGLAMSILMLGFAASISLYPLLSKWLKETVDWREAWVWLGFMTWVLMRPLLTFLVFDKPEPLKLLPDDTVVDGTNGDAQPSGEQAASMFSVSALSMAISMPAVGWVLDRSNLTYIFSVSLVLLALSLVNITFVVDTRTAIIYVIIFGVNTAANMTFFRLYVGAIFWPQTSEEHSGG